MGDLSLPRQTIPVKNKSKHRPYQTVYSNELVAKVAEIYTDDIETYGYKFSRKRPWWRFWDK